MTLILLHVDSEYSLMNTSFEIYVLKMIDGHNFVIMKLILRLSVETEYIACS